MKTTSLISFLLLCALLVVAQGQPLPTPPGLQANAFTTNREPNSISNTVPILQYNYFEVHFSDPGPLTNSWGDSNVVQHIGGRVIFYSDDSSGYLQSFSSQPVETNVTSRVALVADAGATNGLTFLAQIAGQTIDFYMAMNGSVRINVGTNTVGQFDNSVTADDTRFLLWDVTAGTLVRVSRGAVDTGGVGFRVLRIPN